MLFTGKLKSPADKDEHTTSRAWRLAVDGGDGVLTLTERETSEFSNDVLTALDLLTLESQHWTILVQVSQARSIRIKRRVIVLHKGFRHGVWIHLLSLSLLLWVKLFMLSPCFLRLLGLCRLASLLCGLYSLHCWNKYANQEHCVALLVCAELHQNQVGLLVLANKRCYINFFKINNIKNLKFLVQNNVAFKI